MGYIAPTRKRPGFTSERESVEVQVWAAARNNSNHLIDGHTNLASTVTDEGNTNNTTTIRGGNIIAKNIVDGTSNDALLEGLDGLYDDDAETSGLACAWGVLDETFSMLDYDGTASQEFGKALRRAHLKSSELIGLDPQAAAQLWRRGFTFDEDTSLVGVMGAAFLSHPICTQSVGAATLLFTDNGKRIICTAATMTLPTLALAGIGWSCEFFNNHSAACVVTGDTGLVIGAGDAEADGDKVSIGVNAGCKITVMSIEGTEKWVVTNSDLLVTVET